MAFHHKMPVKRKRDKVIKSRHHPSQSSVDVPFQIKKDVKRVQNNRCWLCDCKAHKKSRPLESCHIFPQATSRCFHFETHHKLGRIQLHNIHDRGNLVALCSICHFAFDSDEWMFIPKDTTKWIQRIEAAPQIIREYNSQRSIVFRRLLLAPDPDSKAFQDTHYKSAFTDNPTKMWPGEPGIVIMRPPPAPPPEPTAELQETLDDFGALQKIWLAYKSPCSEENCPICQSKSDGKQGKEADKDDKDDEGDDEDDDDDGDEDDEDDEDDDRNEEDSEEDEEGNADISSSRKSRKRISKEQQSPLQDVDAKKSTQASKRRKKKKKNVDRDWMTSAPYDESIPYSHRYGYTWAGSTSNELMQLWQAYRKVEDD